MLPALAGAQDGWPDDDAGWPEDEDGFAPIEVPAAPPAPPPSRDLTVYGFLRSRLGLWAERFADRPFAKWRQSLDATLEYGVGDLRVQFGGHLEYDFAYVLQDPERFDDATVDTYAARALNGEQFVAYGFDAIELTFGRQIVAWGEGDVLSPLDVVNPRDNREPGLADLDDLRLSVLATRVGWFVGQHRVEGMVIHEAYTGERAPPLADFSPFAAVLADDPMAAALLGDKELRYRQAGGRYAADAQQYLARWVYKGPGLDAGLYAASVLDKQGVVRLPPPAELLALLAADAIAVPLAHRRYTLVGHSGATAFGSWLLKWELAGEIDKAYNTGDPDAAIPEVGVAEGTLITGMLGVSYSGFADTNLALEGSKGVFVDEPAELLFPADAAVFALRFQQTWLRERLTVSIAGTLVGVDPYLGVLARGEVMYALRDGLKLGGGYVTYQPTTDEGVFGPFTGFDEHDRLFAQVRWDFIAW